MSLRGQLHRFGAASRRRGIALLLGWLAGAAPLAALNPERAADSYSAQGWFTEEGLPSNKIRGIVQAADGYLWLATAQGIVRFDGVKFTVFNEVTHPELSGGGFQAALRAPDDTLWFGGDHGLFRWEQGRFRRFTTEDGLPHNYVRALTVARDGAVVVCTRRGYAMMRDGRITAPGGIWKQARGVARSFLERPDGSILLGTSEGLWRIVGEEIERLSDSGIYQGDGFLAMLETPDGSAWIGYSGGLLRVHPDGKVQSYGVAEGLTSPRVAALCRDRDGNLWVSASGDLYRLTGDRVEPASYPGQFNGSPIHAIIEGREGGLWLGSVTGLFRLKDNVSRHVSFQEGLDQTSVNSVVEGPDGAWWIGVWYGGVYRYDHRRAVRLPGLAPLDQNRIFSFAPEPDGTLWIATDVGLYRYAEGALQNFFDDERADEWEDRIATQPGTVLPGIAHNWVNVVARDSAGDLWVGTDAVLYHGRPGRFRALTAADGVPSGVDFETLLCARNGDVWVTTVPASVLRRHDGRWTTYRGGVELPAARTMAMFEDSDGAIWVTTQESGLARFKAGRWRAFGTREGLAHNFISAIVEDHLGNLWIAYPRGIMRIPRREFDEIEAGTRTRLEPRIFSTFDGLPRGEINPFGTPNSMRTRDNRLVFSTDRGLAVIDPRHVEINSLVPPVYIERLAIDGMPADLARPVVVPPGGHDIEIGYTAVSLLAPEKMAFKIRLAPLDRDWMEANAQREVRYAKLPPGRYTFHVIAANNDGVWNEAGARMAFVVRPFFYQTPWFIGLVAATGGVGAFGIYWARVRQARRRMAVLEKRVEERTRQLQSAKENAEAAVQAKSEMIVALEAAEAQVARAHARFKFIFESLPVGVTWMVRGQPASRLCNPSYARITGLPVEHCADLARFRAAVHPEDRPRFDAAQARLLADEIADYTMELRYVHADGAVCWALLAVWSYRDPASGETQEISTLVDTTERKAAEQERENLNRQLVDASRHAGMAEVATGVLHNVGNVLNSVNVSATLVAEQVSQSKAANVAKLAAMFQQHRANLSAFLEHDPRGRMIPDYLNSLTEMLAAERTAIVAELEQLRKNIQHIKDIVAMQQSYARTSGMIERVPVAELVDDALRMNSDALARHEVALVREYEARPTVTTDKHKVVQILINLVRNAKHACDDGGRTDKRIVVRIAAAAPVVRISVTDNGVGIPAENLTRIFNHGFTTRKHGHGFGLHSGALAAKELGGSLTVQSDGPGHGATFTLELPLHSEPSPS